MKKFFAALLGKNGRHSPKILHGDRFQINEQSRFLQLIEMERNRVHRDNQQFSVILLNVDQHQNQEVSISDLAGLIRKRVRRIDIVGWYDHCRLGVLLPHTSTAGAEKVAECIAADLCGIHPETAGNMPFRILSYPNFNNAK